MSAPKPATKTRPGTAAKTQKGQTGADSAKNQGASAQKGQPQHVSVSYKPDPNLQFASGKNDPNSIGGSGEELAQTLEKVVSQLDIISRTLNVLEQRVSMNEESVQNVMAYFRDKDQFNQLRENEVLQYNEQNLIA